MNFLNQENVKINLKEINDGDYCKVTNKALKEMLDKSKNLSEEIIKTVELLMKIKVMKLAVLE